jgi:antitoxin component of RelBE/YafQ-DinJ toxin-antitoxin module
MTMIDPNPMVMMLNMSMVLHFFVEDLAKDTSIPIDVITQKMVVAIAKVEAALLRERLLRQQYKEAAKEPTEPKE